MGGWTDTWALVPEPESLKTLTAMMLAFWRGFC